MVSFRFGEGFLQALDIGGQDVQPILRACKQRHARVDVDHHGIGFRDQLNGKGDILGIPGEGRDFRQGLVVIIDQAVA